MKIAILLCLFGCSISAQSIDSAKELVDAVDRRYQDRFEAQEKWMRDAILAQEKKAEAALAASEKAIAKAEHSTEKRFESVNEFRSQLKDQTASFITRQEAIAYLSALIAFTAWMQHQKRRNQ